MLDPPPFLALLLFLVNFLDFFIAFLNSFMLFICFFSPLFCVIVSNVTGSDYLTMCGPSTVSMSQSRMCACAGGSTCNRFIINAANDSHPTCKISWSEM